MMKNYGKILILLTAFISLGAVVSSCIEEKGLDDIQINEGTTEIKLNAVFYTPQTASLGNLDTRTAGDVIRTINDLFVGFYNSETHKLSANYYLSGADLDVTNNVQLDVDEDVVSRATATINVPNGKYRIIAVANMGNIAELFPDDVKKYDDIVKIRFNWNETDIAANNQLSGYFDDELREPKTEEYGVMPAPEILITGKKQTLHAWLRRAASKVTISFNTDRLNQNTFIYIKSVQIRDIPASCSLLTLNKIESSADMINEGEIINFTADASNPNHYLKNQPYPQLTTDYNEYLRSTYKDRDPHASDAPSLYFYENMQGKGKNKVQDGVNGDPDGEIDYPDGNDPEIVNGGYKDEVRLGTYIEVKGYYISIQEGNEGQGEIVYRFMLGKDVNTDYNAERNYHYKVTLNFVGNANEVDWHIEYKVDDEIFYPDPYYISYLYGQKMMYPVKINGNVTSLEAEIIENGWGPINPEGLDVYSGDVYSGGDKWVLATNPKVPSRTYPKSTIYNGFLSLAFDGRRLIIDPNFPNNSGSNAESGAHALIYDWNSTKSFRYRVYKANPSSDADNVESKDRVRGYGNYRVTKVENGNNTQYTFYVPMYTRPLIMCTATSYTGNNPYFTSEREAKVRFTARFSDKPAKSWVVTLRQVERIINPKAIYRDWNNDDPFDVTLMKRNGQSGNSNYEPYISKGKWTARIVQGDWFTIDGGTTVSGGGGEISFKYKPNGKLASKSATPRCGLIEVAYNNETCFHMIAVRQGYSPMSITKNGARWSCFNALNATSLVSSPLDEGSMFRWGKKESPISAANNLVSPPKDMRWESNETRTTNQTFYIEGSDTKKKWTEIGYTTPGVNNTPGWADWNITDSFNNILEIASIDDFRVLKAAQRSSDLTTGNEIVPADGQIVEIGLGITYADGAKECATKVEEAHGFHSAFSRWNMAATPKTYGMRGVVLYNENTGANVFFPVGVAGYGRRVGATGGTQHYANTRSLISSQYRPLLYDLRDNYGAIYFVRKYETGADATVSAKSSAWDMNISTYDFNYFFQNGNSDACFVRMKVKGTGY